MVASEEKSRARREPISISIFVLMLLAALSFAIASIVHFGTVIPLGPVTLDDPFQGAAIPEGVIAVVLAIGALGVAVHWRARWGVALGTTLFALLLTMYGLTVTVGSRRTGDIIYHVGVLTLLVVIAALLLLPAGRRAMSG